MKKKWQDHPGIRAYDPAYRYNLYSCGKHDILSVDMDKGVTPMFVTCKIRIGIHLCNRLAASNMYPAPPPPAHLFPVVLVWRKPHKDEIQDARRDNTIDYYDKGGLHMEWIN